MGEKKNTASADHRALYRKYRSKKLSEIIGQEHITKTLENALKQGKLSHAYLFTGPRGTGKTSIARILAHEVNNLPYEDESIHLDIIEIDAASNRRIDDIRDLRDKVHVAPVSAKYKVYIIDEVHMLTTESFNALLKTLEEPPEHVIFLLATTEVHKLPATIISRTQRHSLHLVTLEEVAEHLKYIADQEGIQIDEAALKLLAEHGGGSFRDSISLLDQMSSQADSITLETVESTLGLAPKDALTNLLRASQTGDGTSILKAVEALLNNGLTPSAVASQLLTTLRTDIKTGGNSDIAVKLMGDLLTVHNAQYPQLRLETILLGVAAPAVQNIAPEPQTKAPAAAPTAVSQSVKTEAPTMKPPVKTSNVSTPVKKSESTPEKVPAKKTVAASTSQNFTLEEHWPKILEATKQKNNPLYTVLRLAAPEIDAEGLLLIFSFPFHQKKMEESRYKALVAEIVADVTGSSFSVRSIVDKARAKSAIETVAPVTDTAHASLISSVQDIMGGGDIVNV